MHKKYTKKMLKLQGNNCRKFRGKTAHWKKIARQAWINKKLLI